MGLFQPNVKKLSANKDIPGLIKALGYKDVQIREAAAMSLGSLGDGRAVEPLLAALKDSSSGIQSSAAEALGKLKDPRGIEPLLDALTRGTYAQCRLFKAALHDLREVWTVEPFIAALRSSDNDVLEYAVDAIRSLGDACGVEPLIALLEESRPANIKFAAARALMSLPLGEDKKVNHAWFWALKDEWEKCVESGPEAVEPLLGVIDKQSSFSTLDRKHAIQALGKIDHERIVEPLIEIVKQSMEYQREIATAALESLRVRGRFSDPRVIALLVDYHWYAEQSERIMIAAELKAIGKPVIEPLAAMLKQPSEKQRGQAVLMLGELGLAAGVEPLRAVLRDEDESVRQFAMQALRRLVDKQTAREIIHVETAERREALFARVSQGAGSGGYDRDAIRAATELGKMGDARVFDILIAALTDPDDYTALCATEALGELGDARAITPLNALLVEYNSYVSRLKSGAGVSLSQGTLDSLRRTAASGESYRSMVIGAQAQVSTSQLMDILRRMAYIINVLGSLHDGESIQLLQAFTRSNEQELSRAAWEALEKIKKETADKK